MIDTAVGDLSHGIELIDDAIEGDWSRFSDAETFHQRLVRSHRQQLFCHLMEGSKFSTRCRLITPKCLLSWTQEFLQEGRRKQHSAIDDASSPSIPFSCELTPKPTFAAGSRSQRSEACDEAIIQPRSCLSVIFSEAGNLAAYSLEIALSLRA